MPDKNLMPYTFGVLFDMDGVIVHSNPAHKQAIQRFCEKYDKKVDQDFLKNRLYGRTNKEWIPELFGSVSDEKLKKLANEKEQLFRDIFDPKENIVKGISLFLQHLRKKQIRIAVVTSAPKENADYILNTLSLYEYFDAVLDSTYVTRGKPHPEPYLNAAKALGLEAERCVVVEDSLSGVKSGLNAGAKVIGITTTHSKQELSNCHLVIDDFRNLKAAHLHRLFAGQASA